MTIRLMTIWILAFVVAGTISSMTSAETPMDRKTRQRLLAETVRNLGDQFSPALLKTRGATVDLIVETLRTESVSWLWDESLSRPAKAYAIYIGWQVGLLPPTSWRKRTQNRPPVDVLDHLIGQLPPSIRAANKEPEGKPSPDYS